MKSAQNNHKRWSRQLNLVVRIGLLLLLSLACRPRLVRPASPLPTPTEPVMGIEVTVIYLSASATPTVTPWPTRPAPPTVLQPLPETFTPSPTPIPTDTPVFLPTATPAPIQTPAAPATTPAGPEPLLLPDLGISGDDPWPEKMEPPNVSFRRAYGEEKASRSGLMECWIWKISHPDGFEMTEARLFCL